MKPPPPSTISRRPRVARPRRAGKLRSASAMRSASPGTSSWSFPGPLPSKAAYQGRTTRPAQPTRLQTRAQRRRLSRMAPRLLRLAVDFSLPPLEQALALGARAVLREVVVDQLDVGEPRRLRRQLSLSVRRHLELLGVGAELLRLRRQCPVAELLRALEIARALDDAERADLVAGALAGRLDLHGEAGERFGDAVVHEADTDRRLAACDRLDRAHARPRVLVDVAVKLPQVA